MSWQVAVINKDAQLEGANEVNRTNALRTALLLLPDTFSEEELLAKIVGLSYAGDFRMTFGENPRKIQNIVEGQREAFREVYSDLLQDTAGLARLSNHSFQVWVFLLFSFQQIVF